MKVRTYVVLDNAVEMGVNYGWNRAHKHNDSPSEDQIKQEIWLAVMNEITEWFTFDEIEYKAD